MTDVRSSAVRTAWATRRLILCHAVVVALGGAMLAAPASAAPSFSCTGQLSQTETVICSDAELSDLDAAMAAAYERVLAAVSPAQADGIRNAQREWVAL